VLKPQNIRIYGIHWGINRADLMLFKSQKEIVNIYARKFTGSAAATIDRIET